MIRFLKKVHLYGIHRKICFGIINTFLKGLSSWKCRLKCSILRSVGFKIGSNTRIVGPLECTGTLNIGNNTFIGKNLKVNGNGVVTIGDNCDLGPEVTFQTGGHVIGSSERRAGEGRIFSQNVGDGTWIGGRTTVIGDTTIGKGCVVAGCACVIHDVEENSLVGGVPAKVIKKLD